MRKLVLRPEEKALEEVESAADYAWLVLRKSFIIHRVEQLHRWQSSSWTRFNTTGLDPA